MKHFELLSTPLCGLNLIEAGAGTGKTYAIAGLFLRLILEKKMTVDQILVVTYTKAATEELKTRIRTRLSEAKRAFTAGGSEDALLKALIEDSKDADESLRLLCNALVDFDRAAIFTIHGFCQRLLHTFAFETDALFSTELVQDQTPLVQEAVDDFWRRYVNTAPVEFARYIHDTTAGPETLAALFNRCRYPDARVLPAPQKPLLRGIAHWRKAARGLLQSWPNARREVIEALQSPGLNARYYGKCDETGECSQRWKKTAGLADAMERWQGGYPFFEEIRLFDADFIKKSTRKGYAIAAHGFFDLCATAIDAQTTMERQFSAYLQYLKVKLLRQIWRRLQDKKAARNVLFFDDLLLSVHRALVKGDSQNVLRAVQRQYRAALVDEFQDTDPLQYDIFKILFSGRRPVLFLIGDPKQAIYSFRGADVFSYLRAADAVQSQYTLTKNWRSGPGLIKAVNALFGERRRPFGLERIAYEKATAARTEEGDTTPALYLWYMLKSEQDVVSPPYSQQEAAERAAKAVAGEIARLLRDTGSGAAPEQIAVLTRSHHQARIVKQALCECNIPAVLHSAGSVFQTAEADQLQTLLEALAEPVDSIRVRAALAGDLMGATAHDFTTNETGASACWEQRWADFTDYHQAWTRYGFYRMFATLLRKEGIKKRLLSYPDGERRLTNLLHLGELLHQACLEYKLGPKALNKWLHAHRHYSYSGEEAQQLRLESDARAVRILTVHKSKGLQFDYVFCPFTWTGAKSDNAAAVFHDPDAGRQLTLAVGPDIAPAHQKFALEEELAENLRLLYVALTRARVRCYWVWGRINHTELSAPAYLLHTPRHDEAQDDWVDRLGRTMAKLTGARFLEDLRAFCERAGKSVAVAPLPTFEAGRSPDPVESPPIRACRSFRRSIDTTWRISSFSALTAGRRPGGSDATDRDVDDRDHFLLPVDANADPSRIIPMARFPKGSHAGLFFHDLLEHYDFCKTDSLSHASLVLKKLKDHGFDSQWEQAITEMLTQLGDLTLPASAGPFCLNQVDRRDRLNELAFHFPLNVVTPRSLRNVFTRTMGNTLMGDVESALERLTFDPVSGFIKGFVDMVFRHKGRYYLVDWKSNYLGDAYPDYAPGRLAHVMARDFYCLQYHLYAVALDQWLRRRLAGYAYEQHFGGVFYIFLRGVGRTPEQQTGIFYDLPEASLIFDLNQLMIDQQNVSAHERV